LFSHTDYVFPRYQRGNGKLLWIVANNVKGAATDRSGRAKNGQMLHQALGEEKEKIITQISRGLNAKRRKKIPQCGFPVRRSHSQSEKLELH